MDLQCKVCSDKGAAAPLSDPKVLVHFESQINAQKCVGTPQFSDLLRFLLGLPWGVVQER